MRFKYLLLLSFVLFCLLSCGPSKAYKSWERNYNRGVELVKNDSLDSALEYLNTAKLISEKLDDNILGDTKFQLGLLNQNRGQFTQAIPLFLSSANIAKKNQSDSIYINCLEKLADSYLAINNLKDAESTAILKLDVIAKFKGKLSEAYAQSLINLSVIYKRQGNYQLAINTIEESNEIINQLFGKNSIEYINNLSSLTQVYAETGEYKKAILIQKSVLQFFEKEDNKSDKYAYACFTMSYLSHFISKYEQEIEFMEKAVAIYGEEHSHYPVFAGNIGFAYQNLGEYDKALNYLQKAVNLSKNKIDQGYTQRLEKLAFTHAGLGENELAKAHYNEVLDIWDKHLDKNHEDYGQLLNNVGKLYRQIGDYDNAKQLFKGALDNFLNNFNKTHTRYGYMLNDYASMLLMTGEEDVAINLMKENLQIAIDNDLVDTEDYYGRQHNLAKAYNSIGKYTLAIPLLKSATSNITNILGSQHHIYGEMIESLSASYLGLYQVEKALPLIESSNNILLNEIEEVFKFRSESEKQSFLVMLSNKFEKLQSISYSNFKNSKFHKLNEINLNNQLLLKALLLNNSKNILIQLSELNDSLITTKIESYKSSKHQLSQLYSGNSITKKQEIDSLLTIINSKEIELVKLNDTHFSHTKNLTRDWEMVKSRLERNDIAIEFSNFKYYSEDKYTDSTMYVAYVYTKDAKSPKVIPLFEEKQLIKVLKNSSPNSLYKVRGSKATNAMTTDGLYELIWAPIDNYIKELDKKETIYYALTGVLNQIPISAMGKDKQPILALQYNMFQLSSTNNLIEEYKTTTVDNAVLIGGINYDYLQNNTNIDPTNIKTKYSDLSKSKGTKSFGSAWEHLPGTLSEVTTIEQLLLKNNNVYELWTSDIASETKFKTLSGNSPNIIHIATHGFFFENLEGLSSNSDLVNENIYKTSKDPLLRSGLLFSGANYAWKNGSNPNEKDDGILTAMEISNLDLSNTSMVVLSACETGLGDVNGSEGVYGLQRAFKMAGVDIIVMSLWQVPDAETSEFMSFFYKNWLKGDDVKLAFNQTQRYMHKKYKEEPLKWAAFVLFE